MSRQTKKTTNSIRKTTGIKFIGQLKRPVVFVPLVIVLGVIVYFGVRQYKAVQEREAFSVLEQKTALAIEGITKQAGEPLYNDESHTCYMRAPQKFSGKELFCSTRLALYYRINASDAPQSARMIKTSLEESFGVTLVDVTPPKKQGSVYYDFGARELKSLGDISCAMSIDYPTSLRGGTDLPRRNFIGDSVLSAGITCDKQVVKPIYPMVDY